MGYSKYLVANATFLNIYFKIRYIYIQYFAWDLLVVLSARCYLAAWMHRSCSDEIVLGFKSVGELYPSPSIN
jgi:hypothetical protein